MPAKRNPKSKLTDTEAEELLAKLSRHYNEPVKPVSRYCKSFRTWALAVIERDEGLDEKGYSKYLPPILRDISKSNLLARLIYADEPLRTEKCPEHKGHWDGQAQCIWGCTYGCDGTGWLKTTEMVVSRLEHFRKVSGFTDADVIARGEAGTILKARRSGKLETKDRYLYEWLNHLGRVDLIPKEELG